MTLPFSLEWTPAGGRPRKLVFEHQPEEACPWARVEYEYRAGTWRIVGCECLEAVSLSSPEGTELAGFSIEPTPTEDANE